MRYFILFWPHCMACGILVPRPGIKPVPPAVEAWSPNHWSSREFPLLSFLIPVTRISQATSGHWGTVIKRRFYYQSGMVRPPDREAPLKRVCYSQTPGGGVKLHRVGPHGEAPGSVRRQRERGELWARAFTLSMVRARPGEQAEERLV